MSGSSNISKWDGPRYRSITCHCEKVCDIRVTTTQEWGYEGGLYYVCRDGECEFRDSCYPIGTHNNRRYRYKNMFCDCNSRADIRVTKSNAWGNRNRLYYVCREKRCEYFGFCDPVGHGENEVSSRRRYVRDDGEQWDDNEKIDRLMDRIRRLESEIVRLKDGRQLSKISFVLSVLALVLGMDLTVHVMWNGKWDDVDGPHLYKPEPGKVIKAKLISITRGLSLVGFIENIKGKMGADYIPGNTVELHHQIAAPHMNMFPPASISDDSDVDDLFKVYKETRMVVVFVSVSVRGPDETGGQYISKLVPRRAITNGPVLSPTVSFGLEDIDDSFNGNNQGGESNFYTADPGQTEYNSYTGAGPSYSGAGTSSAKERYYPESTTD